MEQTAASNDARVEQTSSFESHSPRRKPRHQQKQQQTSSFQGLVFIWTSLEIVLCKYSDELITDEFESSSESVGGGGKRMTSLS